MPSQLCESPPKRRTVEELRRRIREDLIQTRPQVGSALPSLRELVDQTGASLSTVRRALDGLQREGWIERRMGRGTFVGPRVALPLPATATVSARSDGSFRTRRSAESAFESSFDAGGSSTEQATLRLGVVIFGMDDQRGDWYSRQVMRGMDAEAARRFACVELYGSQGGDVHTLSQRLMASRPEALACVLTGIQDLAVVAEARRLQIPVVGAGYRMAQFGVPSVLADDAGGARLAVQHLIEHGHERIGYVQLAVPRTYVFRRRDGYHRAMADAGLEPEENLTCWLPPGDRLKGRVVNDISAIPDWRRRLSQYIHAHKPTALVVGNGTIMEAVARLVQAGELHIPEDLSLVTFDQTFQIYRGLFGELKPTVVALPWEQFGVELVRMAEQLARGRSVQTPEPLPCQLLPGRTVAPPPGPRHARPGHARPSSASPDAGPGAGPDAGPGDSGSPNVSDPRQPRRATT